MYKNIPPGHWAFTSQIVENKQAVKNRTTLATIAESKPEPFGFIEFLAELQAWSEAIDRRYQDHLAVARMRYMPAA